MSVYSLKSGSSIIATVGASSNLDGTARRQTRRGSFLRTLGGTAVQYLETAVTGDIFIDLDIPVADGNQRGSLYSASVGNYGDRLVLASPKYGDIDVAVAPGAEGYTEEWLPPTFGYRVRLRLVRI